MNVYFQISVTKLVVIISYIYVLDHGQHLHILPGRYRQFDRSVFGMFILSVMYDCKYIKISRLSCLTDSVYKSRFIRSFMFSVLVTERKLANIKVIMDTS